MSTRGGSHWVLFLSSTIYPQGPSPALETPLHVMKRKSLPQRTQVVLAAAPPLQAYASVSAHDEDDGHSLGRRCGLECKRHCTKSHSLHTQIRKFYFSLYVNFEKSTFKFAIVMGRGRLPPVLKKNHLPEKLLCTCQKSMIVWYELYGWGDLVVFKRDVSVFFSDQYASKETCR